MSTSGFAGGGNGGGFFSFSFFSFFSTVVGGCGWLWMWMWRFLSAMIFFSFFLSGGYQWRGQNFT